MTESLTESLAFKLVPFSISSATLLSSPSLLALKRASSSAIAFFYKRFETEKQNVEEEKQKDSDGAR